MKRILLEPNFDKPGSVDCVRRTAQKLRELGMTSMIDARHLAASGPLEGCETGSFEELLPKCDLLLTIGGDGTILHAVQASLRLEKPLLGVNTGHLGFLTQLEADELDKLSLLREGRYGILRRMMLEAVIEAGGRERSHLALNEVVVFRGASDRLAEIEISRAGNPVARHRADGMILATPTGSTAYSLSAGGPIVDPTLSLIVMTAVCPHSHFNHSLILSPEDEYTLRELPGHSNRELMVSVDGVRVGGLEPGRRILVRKSRQSASFLDLGIRDFYSRVDQKLALGGRML